MIGIPSGLTVRLLAALLPFVICTGFLCADDLTTRDGTVYKNYTVLSHDDGFLTIMYADGGGKIPLSNLPDALQKQYGYDPAKCAAAVKATEDADRAEAMAVAKARTQASVASSSAPTNVQPAIPPAQTTKPVAPAYDKTLLTEEQQRQIQQRIADLQADVAEMQAQEARTYSNGHGYVDSRGNGHQVSAGAYPERIREEQAEIASLQAQLGGTPAPNAPATTTSSGGANTMDSLANQGL